MNSVSVVNRVAPLVAVLGLALGGCALRSANPPPGRATLAGNAREFDGYASRRADDLIRMGATKDRNEAEAQAQIDAERRYGPRTGGDTTSWSWTTATPKQGLTQAEIDDALAKAARDGAKR